MGKGAALVLASGGLDSTTLLASAVSEHGAENTHALSIAYGQQHGRELESAQAVAGYYGVRLHTLDLSPVFAESDSALLAHSGRPIPHTTYAQQKAGSADGLVDTFVPFRNGLFLSAAASMAQAIGCDVVYYGAHRDDWAGEAYPDCSVPFVKAMQLAIAEGTGKTLRLEAPFITLSKADIVRLGIRLGVPYELTWSCYEGGEEPCGVCATCIDRRRAFSENGIDDPLLRERR